MSSRRLFAGTILFAALAATTLLAADVKDTPVPPLAPIEKLPAILENATPTSLDELREIQDQTKKVLAKVLPCTVGLVVGGASGSGVIISEDGLILTAGHVSGKPDQKVKIIFQDGRSVEGKSLGQNKGIDSGMVKITTEGKYPFVAMGKSAGLGKGTWVITAGHPGGYKQGRTPVVRLGRILEATATVLRTDCTLVGGDSGGPLFDMRGNVVGIHSRIGPSITQNMHVPVDTYRETWDRLVKGESWGGGFFGLGGGPTPPTPAGAPAYLGLMFDPNLDAPKVTEINKDSPAEKAGFLIDDVLTKFDGKVVKNFDELIKHLGTRKPGDEVVVDILRADKPMTLKVTLGKRPS